MRGLWRAPENSKQKPLKVVPEPEIFNTIVQFHQAETGCGGQDKTYASIAEQYYGIRKVEVIWLLKHCQLCME